MIQKIARVLSCHRYSAHMKYFLYLCFFGGVLFSASADAEEYYVELGRANSEQEAQSTWIEIRDANTKILSGYDVYPNQIIQPNGKSTYRVQAGPMSNKLEAQRVCRRLFRHQVPCFVIEGFDPKNSQSFSDSEEKNPAKFGLQDFLPWMQSPEVVQADPAPAVAQESQKKVGKTIAPAATPDAQVDVAEAIPVPLSESNEVSVSEPVSVFSFDNMFSSSSENILDNTSGWLSVQPFLNEESANSFWKTLKKGKANEVRGLEVKVIHPLVSHDIPKVILAIGSFASEQMAMNFCHNYIASSRYLECSFSAQPPEGEESGKPTVHNDSYSPAAEEYSLFWVEVLSEKSQEKALEKWERIRTDNDDLLSDVRSQITASFSHPGLYVVRIGPLKMKNKAQKLCNALVSRKVPCKLSAL